MDYVLSTIYVVLLLLLYLRDRRREREIKEFRERIEIFDAFITKVLYDVINSSSGQNWTMQNYCANKAFKGDFEPGFMAELMYKDLGLAMNLAREEGVPLFVGGLAHQTYSRIVASGLGKKDSSITIKTIEDLASVKLRL